MCRFFVSVQEGDARMYHSSNTAGPIKNVFTVLYLEYYIILKEKFTITIFTENTIGVLVRITTMLARRRIHIESLNVAGSEVEGIHRFTIVIDETKEETRKLVLQLDKQVDVFKTFFHSSEDIEWQEQLLCKVAGSDTNEGIETDLKRYGVRCISTCNAYTVYEVTGSAETTDAVVQVLEPLRIIEMVKSAGIAVMRSHQAIHEKLKKIEPLNNCLSEVEDKVA
jgi:acetolactate synthase-1/3 small subunit